MDRRASLFGSAAHWMTLSIVIACDIFLRWECLACKPFWFDETYSVAIARVSWRDFGRLLWWREANMSLYYLLLRGWLHVGGGEALIRGLSVAMAALSVPAIYWLVCQLYDRRAALVAAALLSVNTFDVRYAQEARSYALFLLLATLSSGSFVALLGQPTRRNRMVYVATTILASYAHFYALLLLAIQWSIVRWAGIPDSTEQRDLLRQQLRSAWRAISIAVLPLLVFVIKTGAGPIRWIKRPGMRDLLLFFEHLSGNSGWILPALFLIACIATVVPVRRTLFRRDQGWETWRTQFLIAWLVGPITLTVLLSFVRPVFLDRYLIFCLPALLALVSASVSGIRNSLFRFASVTLILFLGMQGVSFVYGHDFDAERDASGTATNFILDHAQVGDGIIFYIPSTRIPYEFFRSLRAGQNTASPSYHGDMGPEILFPHNGVGLDYRDFTGKPTAELVRAGAASHSRVWVMMMNNRRDGELDPTSKMITSLVSESLPQVTQWEFPKVEVRLYGK